MKRKTTGEFIENVRNIHGDEYDYSKVNYINAHTKVCIKHKECGNEFYQKPNTHLNGCGCPFCYGTKLKRTEDFIIHANKVHGNRYDYSKSIYLGTRKKISIICNKHGEFWQTPYEHLCGHGCPICGREIIFFKETFAKGKFIEKSNEIHNRKYDYSKVKYKNNKIKVYIVCPLHGGFWQKPYLHLQGCGCPKCGIRQSKQEENIFDFIKEIETATVLQRDTDVISPYELDIYIPNKRVAIEYDGLIWHSDKFGKDKDYHLNKTHLCEEKGIHLIHIFEDEWLYKSKVVKSRIIELFGHFHKNNMINNSEFVISSINENEAMDFYSIHDLIPFKISSIYLGCFIKNKLISAISFKKETNQEERWILTQFSYDFEYPNSNIFNILCNYFIEKYNPIDIFAFADKRWFSETENNFYNRFGFTQEQILKPTFHMLAVEKELTN